MTLTPDADLRIFTTMKRGDYLTFAVENARREFQEVSHAHQAGEIPATLTTVCDGWTNPRHARVVLVQGDDSQPLSHGMCAECQRRMEEQ